MDRSSGARITLRMSSSKMDRILKLVREQNFRSVSDLVRLAIEEFLVARE